MEENKYEIDEKEEIARVVFAPSMINGDRVSSTAFELVDEINGSPEDYLSVWRTLIRIPSHKTVKFPPRTPGDKLYGYATLNTKEVNDINYDGCTSHVWSEIPHKNNFHVGIYYELDGNPVAGRSNDLRMDMVTSILASKSQLIIIPEEDSP